MTRRGRPRRTGTRPVAVPAHAAKSVPDMGDRLVFVRQVGNRSASALADAVADTKADEEHGGILRTPPAHSIAELEHHYESSIQRSHASRYSIHRKLTIRRNTRTRLGNRFGSI